MGLEPQLWARHAEAVPAMSEAASNDLYNGRSELLGPERAETLMSHMPRYEPGDVATRSDVDGIRTDIADLRPELRAHGELLFGLQKTLIARFITSGAALVGLFVAVL